MIYVPRAETGKKERLYQLEMKFHIFNFKQYYQHNKNMSYKDASSMHLGYDTEALSTLQEIISKNCNGNNNIDKEEFCEDLRNVALNVSNIAVERAEFVARITKDPIYRMHVETANSYLYSFGKC
jgi:hypothetical protein